MYAILAQCNLNTFVVMHIEQSGNLALISKCLNLKTSKYKVNAVASVWSRNRCPGYVYLVGSSYLLIALVFS